MTAAFFYGGRGCALRHRAFAAIAHSGTIHIFIVTPPVRLGRQRFFWGEDKQEAAERKA